MTETNNVPDTREGHHKQDDELKIVIVGGGIAGLATVSLFPDHSSRPVYHSRKAT
jgi:hypothetical protein